MGGTIEKKEIKVSKFPFIEVNPFQKAPFCVDGRAGKVNGELYNAYPQMLGGSLMPVVLEWIINRPKQNLNEVLPEVFQKLKEENYPLGVHTSTHAHEGKSDCGFADNLGKILTTLREKFDEIKTIITGASVDFNDEIWQRLNEQMEKINVEQLPTGETLIHQAQFQGAVIQVLDGEHQETAAIVNLKTNSSLNVDNNQQHQAFNLDLWLVKEIAEKFAWDQNLSSALSLGLYVATEMVLVEEKGKPRLPILINQ